MTIAEVFEAVIPAKPASVPTAPTLEPAAKPAGPVLAPAPEDVAAPTLGLVVGVRDAVTAVADDLKGAWLWDAAGPTVRTLVQHRIPAVELVPGENGALRAVWVAYNHVALALLIPLMFACWVLAHPARLLYALPVAAPIAALWLL